MSVLEGAPFLGRKKPKESTDFQALAGTHSRLKSWFAWTATFSIKQTRLWRGSPDVSHAHPIFLER